MQKPTPQDQFNRLSMLERLVDDNPARSREILVEVIRQRTEEENEELVDAFVEYALSDQPPHIEQARLKAEAQKAVKAEFGLLRPKELLALFGTPNYQLSRDVNSGKLLRVPFRGNNCYPGFQFDSDSGQPLPAIALVTKAFGDATNPWAAVYWLVSNNGLLLDNDGAERRPVDVLARKDLIAEALAHEFADTAL
ncbi:MAG: hypothetical protein DHS20C11_18470 [Lysobacteraceae bacterium]|nr:MAG: hypothetical protein DHS20C11_18470 [Xanthomonadaceae bacterium]